MGSCNQYLLDRLLSLQKKAVRIICNKPFRFHSKPLFLQLNILPVYQLGICMYSYCNNMLPSSFNDLFQTNNAVHEYNTRIAKHLRVRFGKTNFSQSIVTCKGPLIWNALPDYVKEAKTLNTFKRRLKQMLMQEI